MYGRVEDNDKFANQNNSKTSISFIEAAVADESHVNFTMNGFDYGIEITEGKVNKDLRITEENQKIKANMA